ncbi:MAG: hypothetical protein H0T18_00230 [Chloroflexia bacterium]|nr:hypothetical protein [Chloroflexia bacterium]
MPATSSSAAPIVVDDDLLQAAHAFFPELTAVETVPGHPNVVKITTPAGLRRVHRWPDSTPMADIAFSRKVMAIARSAGMAIVPELFAPPDADPESALRLRNHVFDAQGWLPGFPPPRSEAMWPNPENRIDIPVALPSSIFASIVAAAASLHDVTVSLATKRDLPSAPLAMLPGAVRQAHGRHLAALRIRARREPAIQRWLATAERLMTNAEPVLHAAAETDDQPAVVLCLGLWPAHVLLDDDSVHGLLGWERVATGSPLLDIAQATLRLQGWSDEAVETALAAYGDVRPLSPQVRRLLPAVAALDAVATTGRLLEQTFAVDETARPPSSLRSAIDMMLRSMTALDRNLITQAAVGKSKRTPWRRGPLPNSARKGVRPRERRR